MANKNDNGNIENKKGGSRKIDKNSENVNGKHTDYVNTVGKSISNEETFGNYNDKTNTSDKNGYNDKRKYTNPKDANLQHTDLQSAHRQTPNPTGLIDTDLQTSDSQDTGQKSTSGNSHFYKYHTLRFNFSNHISLSFQLSLSSPSHYL